MALPTQIPQPESARELSNVPLGGTRAQAMHRLQIGIAGVVGIVLLVGLASLVEDRAQQTEATAVPQAASTAEPENPATQADPLIDAGVVPDLPASPTPSASAAAPILPEQGGETQGAAGTRPVEN